MNSVKEKLSKAYLYSLSAKLNLGIQENNKDYDSCGYDFKINNKSLGAKRTVFSEINELNIQLKGVSWSSQSMIKEDGDAIVYTLGSSIPKFGNSYLVIVTVPPEDKIDEWIVLDGEQLVLKKCAYYYQVPSTGLTSGKVRIPKTNIITPDSFMDLFNNISKDIY